MNPLPSTLSPSALAAQLPCKACGAPAFNVGAVDFRRYVLAGAAKPVFEPAGVPIHHHRCGRCGFLFTAAFDRWTTDDFRRHIYNDGYAAFDPDYLEKRPRLIAKRIAEFFPRARSLRVLDYGGGNGRTAELLRAEGFAGVEVYEPFVPGFSARPRGKFDLILCVEVAEHATDPKALFADLAGLVADPGLVFLSTLLQPANITEQQLDWWYVGPRNGHVSFYTLPAMAALAQPLGIRAGSVTSLFHVLVRQPPAFASHWFGAPAAG